MHFRFDSSRFASLVFSVLPCQDFPLGHRGIISLVGYLGGEVGAARRPRKEAFNKEPRPCLPIGPRGLHRDSPSYLLSNIRSNIRPQTLPVPTPPCSEPRPLASVWRGGGRPSHPPGLTLNWKPAVPSEQDCWLPPLPKENLWLQFLQFTSFI